MLFAIVDIETTGGHAAASGITEIAIVIHDGKKTLHTYESLVNPGQPIPPFIQSLTGITNEMVAHAPSFKEIAWQVEELLRDKVFVAHNVNFDYSFVKHQLAESGYFLNTKKLCTVRLARKILPGLPSYSLGRLCSEIGIAVHGRHRAGGDAKATAELFSILVAKDNQQHIPAMLKGRNKEQYLPPHLPIEAVDHLPDQPGVYYFYNARGKVIYIGKAQNISRRIKSHFSNNKTNRQKQDFLREIHNISYKVCATELMAEILESHEIRRHWPIFNRSQRGYLPQYGLYVYEDRKGYQHLAIEKNKANLQAIFSFNTITEGHQKLRELIREFELCPRLCHLAKVADCNACIEAGTCKGHCQEKPSDYNARVSQAINHIQAQLPSFAYLDKGIYPDEESCILMLQGNVYGMGYIKSRDILKNIMLLSQQLEPLQHNDFVRNLILKHASVNPAKCIPVS